MSTRVLILPGLGNSGPDHWQSHWERGDAACQRVEQDDWDAPDCKAWVSRLSGSVDASDGPLVLAAHSAACALVAHWAATASSAQLSKIRARRRTHQRSQRTWPLAGRVRAAVLPAR